MALKDHKPEFETDNDIATATATETPTMTASAATSDLPAVAAPSAVAAPKKRLEPALSDIKNAFPTEVVVALSMATPRIKAEQGQAYVGDKPLGDKIRMQIESWNSRRLYTCGLQSKDPGYQESMQYLKNSYDGETIEGTGQRGEEYLAYLKSLGYEKAGMSNYVDIWGFVTWTSKDGDIAVESRELCLLQASQTSAGNFMAFCTTQGLLQSKGIAVDLSEVEVHAMARTNGSNKFTNFSFVTVKK